MFRPLFYAPLAIALVLLQQVPQSGTIGTFGKTSSLELLGKPGEVDLLCFPIMQVPTASSTIAITAATLLSLTAAQTTALAAVAILGIKAKLIGAYLLSQRGSSRRGARRGKRSAEEEEVPTIETFAALEVEDCYKRVICAASTGEVENPQVESVLALFNPQQFMQAPLSHKAMKFVEAARYGGSRRSVAKCEHRYTCSLGMDLLQDLF